MKLEKMFFISLQKFLSFSGKSNFRILDIQISLHQMPNHKTRNTFYWITWEVNTVSPVYVVLKEKILSKHSTKTATWKVIPRPFVFAKK